MPTCTGSTGQRRSWKTRSAISWLMVVPPPIRRRDPFAGIGKPEPLRENLAGCWSRRIDEEHRLVYQLDGELLVILACRYHDR